MEIEHCEQESGKGLVPFQILKKLFILDKKYIIFLEETNEEAVALLGETNWMGGTVEELKLVRNKFCQLVNIPVPQIVKKPV